MHSHTILPVYTTCRLTVQNAAPIIAAHTHGSTALQKPCQKQVCPAASARMYMATWLDAHHFPSLHHLQADSANATLLFGVHTLGSNHLKKPWSKAQPAAISARMYLATYLDLLTSCSNHPILASLTIKLGFHTAGDPVTWCKLGLQGGSSWGFFRGTNHPCFHRFSHTWGLHHACLPACHAPFLTVPHFLGIAGMVKCTIAILGAPCSRIYISHSLWK